MASVRKKGDKWEVRYYTPDQSGRLVRRSKMVTGTRKEALAQGAMLEGGLTKGSKPRGMTVERATLAWWAKGGRRTSERSGRAVEYRVKNYINPHIGAVPLEAVTPHTVEGLYHRLAEAGLGVGSIQNVHWDLSGTFNMAVRYGWVDDNPMTHVERASYQPAEVVPPSGEEIEALLGIVDDEAELSEAAAGLGVAIRLAVATGARRGELAALTWGDIFFDAGAVRVYSPKTRTSRVIGVEPAVIAALVTHRERVAALGLGVASSDPILRKDTGEPITPNALGCRFRLYAKRAGLTCSIHDLRHFTASVWLEHMKPVDVSRAIGHARVSTTLNVYGHVLDRVDIDRRPQQALAKRVRL